MNRKDRKDRKDRQDHEVKYSLLSFSASSASLR